MIDVVRDTAADEAVRWFVTLRDSDATEDDLRRFVEWRSADRQNADAWDEVQRLWGALDQLAPKYQPTNVVALTARVKVIARWSAAAAAAFVVLLIGWQFMPVGLFADYRTAIAERKTVRLQDGSEIELAGASAIDVDIGAQSRNVRLLAGEAFFTVARDEKRPFVVTAGKGQIKVLGTAFDVKITKEVTVAVAHNTVEVTTASAHAPSRVSQSQMVRYDGDGMSAVEPADLSMIEAWRSDELIFKDARLEDVMEELRRHYPGRIQLFDSNAGDQRVTAVVDIRNVEEDIEAIATSLGLDTYKIDRFFIGITD